MIMTTNYSIPNKDLAESELKSLVRLNEMQNCSKLLHFQVVKDKVLCFDNYNLELVFEIQDENISSLLKKQTKIDEKEIWIMVGDLLQYLNELNSYNLNNGDL